MARSTARRAAVTGGIVLGLFFLLGPVLGWMPYSSLGLTLGVIAWVVVTAYVFFAVRWITRRDTDAS